MPISYAQIEAAKQQQQQQQNNSGNWIANNIANIAATLRASAERKAREQELPEVVIKRKLPEMANSADIPKRDDKLFKWIIIAAVALIAFYLYRNYGK